MHTDSTLVSNRLVLLLPQGLFFFKFSTIKQAFTFSFCHQKEKDNKKKDCRLRSGAKKSSYFPKRKELASLKQLFVLNGKYSIFLHAPPLRPE